MDKWQHSVTGLIINGLWLHTDTARLCVRARTSRGRDVIRWHCSTAAWRHSPTLQHCRVTSFADAAALSRDVIRWRCSTAARCLSGRCRTAPSRDLRTCVSAGTGGAMPPASRTIVPFRRGAPARCTSVPFPVRPATGRATSIRRVRAPRLATARCWVGAWGSIWGRAPPHGLPPALAGRSPPSRSNWAGDRYAWRRTAARGWWSFACAGWAAAWDRGWAGGGPQAAGQRLRRERANGWWTTNSVLGVGAVFFIYDF